MIRRIAVGTGLSILVFWSLSFLTVLKSIFFPSFNYSLDIGFPFFYYKQFWLSGNGYPNFDWNIKNLLLDMLLVWLMVTAIYILTRRKKQA